MTIQPVIHAHELSELVCMNCDKREPLFGATAFICSNCGSLFDVIHNHKIALAGKTIEQWKQVFDQRAIPNTGVGPKHSSGVWRFGELLMPSLGDDEIVSLGEGIIPFWRGGKNLYEWIGGGLNLYILPEGLSPTGSFKDFGMTVMMSVAKASSIQTVGCSSTGDTSASAAAYAAAAGIRCVVILPQKGDVTEVQLSQPLAHDGKIAIIPGPFDVGMRIILQLSAEGRLHIANSANRSRIEGHQASVCLAAQHLRWNMPDWFVVPLGNGSNSSSIGKGMRLLEDLGFVSSTSQILAVQAGAANPLARSWEAVQHNNRAGLEAWEREYSPQELLRKTTATAMRIGSPVSAKTVMREITASQGAVLTAEEEELNEAVMVCGRDGYSVCPQTGAAIAGLRRAVARGIVKSGSTVVLVSTATGLKFPNVSFERGKSNIIHTKTCDIEEVAAALGL